MDGLGDLWTTPLIGVSDHLLPSFRRSCVTGRADKLTFPESTLHFADLDAARMWQQTAYAQPTAGLLPNCPRINA
jgi:hypothetical protein